MKIVSLFDGMACGMLAMLGANINVDEYYAYEIDKYAVQTATHNFPNIIECGDVFKADFTQYKDVDFIVGGSPCTYWSIAQKNNRETEASGLGWELFSQYVRALNEIKPMFFIYENNKSMSKAIRESITEAFGFDAICINSALVSAQNRQRLYWVGKRNEDGTYSRVDVQQPEDRGILLRDILDGAMDLTSKDKAWTLTASYNGAVAWNTIERSQRNMAVVPIGAAQRGRYVDGEKTEQHIEVREDGKSNCLTTVQKDSLVCAPVRIGQYGKGGQGQRIYSVIGKSVTLSANGGGQGAKTGLYKINLPDGDYIIRNLSVNECKRLQTVPEWYEFPVSNAQAYKMLGNGWTVDVIIHLIKSCLTKI